MVLERGCQPSPAEQSLREGEKRGARLSLPDKCRGKLTSSRQFSRVYERGTCYRSNSFKVFLLPNGLGFSRVGFSNRKGLKAIERNRLRRVYKEAYRKIEKRVIKGFDILFVIKDVPGFAKLIDEIEAALKTKGMLDEGGSNTCGEGLR